MTTGWPCAAARASRPSTKRCANSSAAVAYTKPVYWEAWLYPRPSLDCCTAHASKVVVYYSLQPRHSACLRVLTDMPVVARLDRDCSGVKRNQMMRDALHRFREALDAALAQGRPEVVASVLGELSSRGGLDGALGNIE